MGRWWKRVIPGYGANVQPVRFKPEPRPGNLVGLEGRWVAVLDGTVVQAAETSHELALMLHGMDHRRRSRVVVEFVRPDTDAYIVGVG